MWYHIGTIGHAVKECKSFWSKLQKLIEKEGPSIDGLNQRHGKEKSQELLGPFRIMYHKEKARPMVEAYGR